MRLALGFQARSAGSITALPPHGHAAEDVTAASDSVTVLIDMLVAPTINLATYSDLGASASDDITNDLSPRINIIIADSYGAGDHVLVEEDTGGGYSQVKDYTLASDDLLAGSFYLGLSPVSDGSIDFRVRMQVGAAYSNYSNVLTVTFDTSLGDISLSVASDPTIDATPDIIADISATTAAADDILVILDSTRTAIATHTITAGDVSGGSAVATPASDLPNGVNSIEGYIYRTGGEFTSIASLSFTIEASASASVGDTSATATDGVSGAMLIVGTSADAATPAADSVVVTDGFAALTAAVGDSAAVAYDSVSSPSGAYAANAVNFDGSATWLRRGAALTGGGDSKQFIISIWSNVTDATTLRTLFSDNYSLFWFDYSHSRYQLSLKNSSHTTLGSAYTNAVYGGSDGWLHHLIAGDLSTNTIQWYINDSDALSGSPSFTNDNVYWGNSDFYIGAYTSAPSNLFYGDMSDYLIWTGATTDLSVTANRRYFIDASGKPVNPATAIAQFGTPLVAQYDPTATWQNNEGSGGGFTENGTLTTASTSPSD